MCTLIMIMIYAEDNPVSTYIGTAEGDIVDTHLHDQLIGQQLLKVNCVTTKTLSTDQQREIH